MPLMSQMRLPKIKDYKVFEKLVLDCLNTIYEGQTLVQDYFYLYGRVGQNRHGIDLISYDGKAVVLCKNYLSETSRYRLFESVSRDIDSSLAYFSSNNELIEPDLFIVATAMDRDIRFQDMILKNQRGSSYRIEVLFWDDFEQIILNHEKLLLLYYPVYSSRHEEMNSNADENSSEDNKDKLFKSKETLFKYTSLEYIESCIKYGVYASRIDQVNDPFESDGVKYPHLYRICCMTNSPKKMLLWAYYTNHKGCCVEFDVSSVDETLLKKVEYYDSFSPHSSMSLDEIYTSLYHKGKEWKHENEYRAVYYDRKKDTNSWNYNGNLVFLNVPVKSVTFGLFADSDLQKYKNALEVLEQYGIEAKKCRLKNNRYELEDDPQFDLQIELENAKEKLLQNTENTIKPKLDSDELQALKTISGLQSKDSVWVPFEMVAQDKNMVLIVEALQNKGMLKMKTEEKDNSFRFYICISELGLLYL